MESIAEIWKDIQGYEGLYQVSNLGRVKSLGRNIKKPLLKSGYCWQEERILKPYKNRKGYLNVRLCKDSRTKDFQIHRLVAIAFIPNPENKPQIDHINADKTNNNVNNLRWVTCKENIRNPLNMVHLTGKNHPMFGKKHTEETKRKISDRLSGKNHYLYGKHMSEETKEKLRGKNNPTSRKVRNIETNEIFYSVTEAGKKYGVTHSAIRASIKKNRKSAGYHWEYV